MEYDRGDSIPFNSKGNWNIFFRVTQHPVHYVSYQLPGGECLSVAVVRWQQDKNGKEARDDTVAKSVGCIGEGKR